MKGSLVAVVFIRLDASDSLRNLCDPTSEVLLVNLWLVSFGFTDDMLIVSSTFFSRTSSDSLFSRLPILSRVLMVGSLILKAFLVSLVVVEVFEKGESTESEVALSFSKDGTLVDDGSDFSGDLEFVETVADEETLGVRLV